MHSPKVSILLVVKNAYPLVLGALDSLKKQTFNDFDVIVTDGASTDGTLGALHEEAKELKLRLVSEPDRSLADGFAKALARADADIVGMLCADERYYPHALAQVVEWFDDEPDTVMCGGKVDFIDEHGYVVGSHLTAPFDLRAHLACELVPSNLSSFFNRCRIGPDFRFDADVPSCPDYEFWARLGFRFPASAFKRHDLSVAQAYRTRDSMSFRAECFTQFCRDKLAHLNNLLAKGYGGPDRETLRQRAAAGIHMWAAEQLSGIEPGHPDILAHCAAAARYDRSYERVDRLVGTIANVRYDAKAGAIRYNRLGPQTAVVGRFEALSPHAHWDGSTLLEREPLTIRTSTEPWGYSLEMAISDATAIANSDGGQYWARIDLEVIQGAVGISVLAGERLMGEQLHRKGDGLVTALIPVDFHPMPPLMVRSGGHPSSLLRIYGAELLRDPDPNLEAVAPIELTP